MEFIERLKLELEDLQEFLRGLPLNLSDCKVGDFGCEWGYTTLSLMLALNAAECIGIDTFLGNGFSPSFQSVQQTFDQIKTTLLATPENSQENKVIREIRHLLRNGRFPMFQQDDIVQSNSLPNNLDFAFCKLVLGNIFNGEYHNPIKGKDGIDRAIRNIAKSTKQNGVICLVERDAMNFTSLLQGARLTPLRICRISRGDIGTLGRLTSSVSIVNYIVYLCKKL
jgi:hypothetical protein